MSKIFDLDVTHEHRVKIRYGVIGLTFLEEFTVRRVIHEDNDDITVVFNRVIKHRTPRSLDRTDAEQPANSPTE